MLRTIAEYEMESTHQHRGQRLYGARHSTYAPFACNAPLALHIEPNPSRHVPGIALVTERCQGCGKIVSVCRVLPELEPVNNDDVDDCA